MTHSYKAQVTAEHDAFCIGAALKSALENRADNGDYSVTIEDALEEAYGYIAEGLSNCRCMFAGLKGEARMDYLLQFSDDSLVSMTNGGYFNDSTGELMTITWDEFVSVSRTREERVNHSYAEMLADEIAGEVDPVVSDTVSVPLYSLLVAGKKSDHGTFVTRWGIAYAVAREMLTAGIDPEFNTGIISAVLETLENDASVIAGGLENGPEFSTVFEANN